jgi:hypothetical protein
LSSWTARSIDTGVTRVAARIAARLSTQAARSIDTGVTLVAASIDARLSSGTARSIDTGVTRRTAAGIATRLTSRAATSVVETGCVGITAGPVAAIVRATISIRTARCAGIVTAGAALAGVTRWATYTRAARHVAVLTFAAIAGSRQTNRATDVGRRAAPPIQTTLTRGAAAAVANLVTGTAGSIHAGLPGIAAHPMAAVVRATVSALAAVVAGRKARSAYSVTANLGCGAAVRAGVAGAKAAAVSDTAN